MKLKQVKHHLLDCISSIVSHSQDFIHHPATAFSRTSPLDLKTMLYALLAMGGDSLSNALPILAVDGSDVCIPRNRLDSGTLVQNSPESTPYNLIHINALYDITNGIYHDLLIQDKRDQDERAAFLNMMENSPFRTSTRYSGQRI